MKNFYLTLFFLGMPFFLAAQDPGGTPVQGLIPIKRINNTAKTTTNSTGKISETAMPSVISTIPAPTGNSTEVGITQGELSVSLNGAATYAVPIAVPPGINGVVPQISLVYNSQGGNGMAGYGWNISGISVITRIPRTKFHDGVAGGVNLDANDRFALDGQRLILKSGSSYGEAGTVYETENFSNVRITAVGVSSLGSKYGPASFLVEYPDGSIAGYGATTDSKSLTTWSITYWENPQGVRISYNYIRGNYNSIGSNDSILIAGIKYGATDTGTAINEIQFTYDAAARQEQSYVGGSRISVTKILDKINVTGNGLGFRSYNLEKETTRLNYQRLIKITETGADGAKSYNPTVFTYENTNESISYANITTSLSLENITSQNAGTVSGDFIGDENMEFLIYPTIGPDTKSKYWLFSDTGFHGYTSMGVEHDVGAFETIFPVSWLTQSNKLFVKQGWAVAKKTDIDYTFEVYNAGIVSPVSYQYKKTASFPTVQVHETNKCKVYAYERIFPKKILSGDFNGDGLTDVIAIDTELTDTYPLVGDCNRTNILTIPSKKVYFIDLKRDNITDFLTESGELATAITLGSKVEVADVNGDGKSDFLVFENGKVTVYTLDAINHLILLWNYSDANIAIDPNKTILLGDYNGDGKTDFIIPKEYGSTQWHKYISTGNNFSKEIQNYQGLYFNQNTPSITYNYIAADYNKDGKSDLIETLAIRKQTDANGVLRVNCYFNINETFYNNPSAGTTGISTPSPDIKLNALPIYLPTGRGIATTGKPFNPTLEIAFLGNNKIFYFNSDKDNTRDQLLRTITTGNGVRESITYQPLSSDAVNERFEPIYTPNSFTENYPQTDIESAATVQVVTKLEKQSAGSYRKQLFAYVGATSNLEGLGYLGFRASMRTNWFEDETKAISFISRFDPNLRGANIGNYTYLGLIYPSAIDIKILPTYNLIAKSVSVYETDLSPTKVFKLQNVQSENYNIPDGTESQTTVVYDGYNNPTESVTQIKSGGVIRQTTTTATAYDSATTPYMVGRPKSKTQTVTTPGDSMNAKETYRYGSGAESNLLKTIQKWGNNTDALTETNTYDTFGNITQKIISASGIADRKTSFKYDPTGRFLTESTDIEGLKTVFVYNTDGTLQSETNPYGLTTSYLYDSWFKKTKTTDYLGKNNTYSYARNGNVNTLVTTTGDDGSYSEELFDDLGRKIRAGVKDITGAMSSVDYLYDIYDRNYKTSEPYSGSPSLWNTTTYDVYGRTETVTDFTGKTLTMTYDKLTTTATDSSTGQTKTAVKNAMGNVITMTESPIGGTVNYSYFANGNLKSSDYDGVTTTIEQDGWGKKTGLTDPSAGNYAYEYNAPGETTKETTPNGTTTYKLNDWGKPESKTITGSNTDSNTRYTYAADSKLLLKTVFTDAGDAGKTITTDYTYDSQKRLETTTETNGYGAVFTKKLKYDDSGRIDTETGTASLNGKTGTTVTQNEYKNGFLYKIYEIKNGQRGKTLWETNAVNAGGQLTKALLGNGIVVNNTYDSYGYATGMKHTLGTTATTVMELTNDFDPQRGNLNRRKNSLFGNVPENFKYDSQDRLTEFTNAQGAQETQAYDERGRITQNNLGTYRYTKTSEPYKNTSVLPTPEALAYYTEKPIQSITYNTFKSPVQIEEKGIDKISFVYNDGNDRSAMFYGSLDNDKLLRPNRKFYSADGTMEIKYNKNTGATEFVTYIGGDGYSAPIVYKKTYDNGGNTQEQTLYLHRDYQGSILAITDEAGVVLEKRQFDAWGNIVKVQDGVGNNLNVLTILDRGYTGHEHLQSVGLINMNGRVYDPKLHRFLQPDNYVQDPSNTQNFNRYAYVLNNPLKYIDPSGEYGENPTGPVTGGPGEWDTDGVKRFWKDVKHAWGEVKHGIDRGINQIKGWFKHSSNSSEPPPNTIGYVNIQMPTQHNSLGFNWTYLSEGKPGERFIYGVGNMVNILGQIGMARNVGSTMRNLDGSLTTTDQGVFALVDASTFTLGIAEIRTTLAAVRESVSGFRYMSQAELNAVQKSGLLRGGRPGETFFTKDIYTSSLKAQQRLALPNAPTLRVEFQILNNPSLLRNGTKVTPSYGMSGGGAEFMTTDPVMIRLINWQPLR